MKTKIEFTYEAELDEHRVFDGRELARQMIGSAYRLLVPYVRACPACADNLFSVIANGVIEELHSEARDKGRLAGFIMAAGEPGEDRTAREKAHLAAAENATKAMLEKAGGAGGHEH